MKKIAILIIFLMITVTGFAQDNDLMKIDSLKIELKKAKNDTIKINILNEICFHNFYRNPSIGMGYSEIALNISTKINWKKGMAVAYNHLGMCNWVTKNYEKSIKNFKKALFYYKELKDQKNTSDNYNHLGTVYGDIGNYKQALTYFNSAYQINTKINHIYQTANDLFGMAEIYNKMGDYEKALAYYIKAKQKYSETTDVYGISIANFNIGKTYNFQKKYATALQFYDESLTGFIKIKSRYHIASTYLEIGRANYNFSFEHKSEKSKYLKLAIKNLIESIRLFTEDGKFDKVNECYIELSKSYEENGEFKMALECYKKYVNIDQTVLTYEKENRLSQIKTEKEFELRDKKIEIQKLHIKRDSRKVYTLVIITIATAILLSLILLLYALKRKTNRMLLEKNKEISTVNKQKDKFFSIIAHDLRGPFGGFLGLTELLAEDIDMLDKEEIQFTAVNMRSSAHNLSSLLDNLLEWSRMEQGLIAFKPKNHNLLQIVKECTAMLQDASNKKDLVIENSIDDSLEIYADRNISQSVFRNILSNAIKFTPKKGAIKIEAKEDANNTIISISDTGIGMNAEMVMNAFQLDTKINRKGTEDEPSSGLGLILCKEFIEKHGGKIWIESEENIGTTFHLSFPKQPQV
ncbi:tetratricopeptide repeat protein [Flavobacterium sp.]|uniref:tetratricopeptide repeat protein n=1 Tax=Flavobacterium sp. TaxID=239 RepID=UPI002D093F9D|nr:tetratricopeptide repeat protein [Flavobacterium sp.]HSD09269.1 tetratricopeptide repeat protein [Flavobacterium sp.]